MQFLTNNKWLFAIVFTGILIWSGSFIQREVQFFQGRPAASPGDFQVYYTAGLVVRKTTDRRLYAYREIPDPNNLSKTKVINPQLDYINPDSTFAKISIEEFPSSEGIMGKTQYLYPPFTALLISPITYLPFGVASKFWYAFTLFLIFISIFLAVKIYCSDFLLAFGISGLIMLVVEFTFPVQDLLWSGNIGGIILFLCSAGLFYLHKNHPVLSSFFISIAVFIKLTPIILIPLMIIRKQWTWLIAFSVWCLVLGIISLAILGWQNHHEFVYKILPAMSNGIAERNNRSLAALGEFIKNRKVSTFEDFETGSEVSINEFNLPFKFVSALLLITLLFYFWKVRDLNYSIISEANLLLLISLVISPISWRHSYVLAIFPLIHIWGQMFKEEKKTIILITLSLATFFILSVIPDYGLSVINSFTLQLLLVSIMPLGVLLVIICGLRFLQNSSIINKNAN